MTFFKAQLKLTSKFQFCIQLNQVLLYFHSFCINHFFSFYCIFRLQVYQPLYYHSLWYATLWGGGYIRFSERCGLTWPQNLFPHQSLFCVLVTAFTWCCLSNGAVPYRTVLNRAVWLPFILLNYNSFKKITVFCAFLQPEHESTSRPTCSEHLSLILSLVCLIWFWPKDVNSSMTTCSDVFKTMIGLWEVSVWKYDLPPKIHLQLPVF